MGGFKCSLLSVMDWVDHYNGAITAISTFIIATFTVFLVRVSNRQARLITGQIELAREEFDSAHRPRLRIRNIAFDWQRTPGSERPRVWFAIVNTGETTACKIELRVDIVFKYNDKWEVPIDRQIMGISPRFLADIATGDNRGCYVETTESVDVVIGSLTKGTNFGIPVMFVAGYITYRGNMGAGYSTFFVRGFDHVQNTFKPSADPEENYED
jgi:hypothetical protein